LITAAQIRSLFPFSVPLDNELRVRILGRSLSSRIANAHMAAFTKLFRVERWNEEFNRESLLKHLGHPVLLVEKQTDLTLMGSFERIDEGYVFLGGPRVERIEELEQLGLSISEFAAHDGVMHHLFLLQKMQIAADEAAKAARELAVQERRYRQIVEESNDIILGIRPDGVVSLANPAGKKLLQLEPGETQMETVLQDESRLTWQEAISQLNGQHSAACVDLSLRGQGDTSIMVEAHLVRSRADNEPRNVLGFLRDVTARKAAELGLERSNHQLRQAQKMEAIGRFAGGIAHDFNNLLAVMMGAGSMLKDGLPENDSRRQEVDMIMLSVEKGAALARQLLLFSRREPVPDAQTELVGQTRELMQILDRVIGKGVNVSLETRLESIHVAIDPVHYEQVIMNLVINAQDAMPDGGKVHIKISAIHDSIGAVTGALVEVSDTGEGMTEECLQRAFEPFYTTKSPERGSGLGLSVVYGIVTDSGGDIDVSTVLGKGTTFTLHLPLTTRAASASRDRQPPTEPAYSNGPRAVLVEDQHDLRRLMTRKLEQMGFEVYSFGSIAEARAGVESLSSSPEILVTDVKLGDGNGLDLAEEMTAQGRATNVVIITGHANLARIDQLIIQHGWRLLMKPFSSRQLGIVVDQLMDRS